MLTVRDTLPQGFLHASARDLHRLLPGPTLMHLTGRRPEPLFVSVLLHGNEDTGLRAVQLALQRLSHRELPRALSVFVGNVQAAALGLRRLDGQPDYNRVWPGIGENILPEHRMTRQVVDAMRERRVFASIDFHNNTGLNPHYACVNAIEQPSLHLATLFSRIVVLFRRPLGVQAAAFATLCPAVTVECGRPGNPASEQHAAQFLDAALHLDHFPAHPVAVHDVDLYHTVGIVKVPEHVEFSFTRPAALQFDMELERMNFRDVARGTRFARINGSPGIALQVWDEDGAEVADRYFALSDGELRTLRPVTPAMLTTDTRAIRLDCLCYLMERVRYP